MPSTVAEMRWDGEGERRDKLEEVRSARSGQRRAWLREHRGAEQGAQLTREDLNGEVMVELGSMETSCQLEVSGAEPKGCASLAANSSSQRLSESAIFLQSPEGPSSHVGAPEREAISS
jgi:hypothetical protein